MFSGDVSKEKLGLQGPKIKETKSIQNSSKSFLSSSNGIGKPQRNLTEDVAIFWWLVDASRNGGMSWNVIRIFWIIAASMCFFHIKTKNVATKHHLIFTLLPNGKWPTQLARYDLKQINTWKILAAGKTSGSNNTTRCDLKQPDVLDRIVQILKQLGKISWCWCS